MPDWLTAALGPGPADETPLPWGFTNETWAATRPGGRRVAATRYPSAGRATVVRSRLAALAAPLAAADVPIPALEGLADGAPEGVVVTRFVAGETGARLLGRPGGAARVGDVLGAARHRLDTLDAEALAELGLDDHWVEPARIAATAAERAEEARSVAVGAAVAALEREAAGRPPRRAFVHGDLVPVNVVIEDGRLAALLDLGSARIGDAALDAGWFEWIVGHHHPELLPGAWAAFRAAARIDDDGAARRWRRLLAVARILEILADEAPSPDARARWLAQLEGCARFALAA